MKPTPHTKLLTDSKQGHNPVLALEDDDGVGLYLTVAHSGKEAAPHVHGVWCVNAAISGQEVRQFNYRSDDGIQEGYTTIEQTGEVPVAPGHGMPMADPAIHATKVGDMPAIGLALYDRQHQDDHQLRCGPNDPARRHQRRRGLSSAATTKF